MDRLALCLGEALMIAWTLIDEKTGRTVSRVECSDRMQEAADREINAYLERCYDGREPPEPEGVRSRRRRSDRRLDPAMYRIGRGFDKTSWRKHPCRLMTLIRDAEIKNGQVELQ